MIGYFHLNTQNIATTSIFNAMLTPSVNVIVGGNDGDRLNAMVNAMLSFARNNPRGGDSIGQLFLFGLPTFPGNIKLSISCGKSGDEGVYEVLWDTLIEELAQYGYHLQWELDFSSFHRYIDEALSNADRVDWFGILNVALEDRERGTMQRSADVLCGYSQRYQCPTFVSAIKDDAHYDFDDLPINYVIELRSYEDALTNLPKAPVPGSIKPFDGELLASMQETARQATRDAGVDYILPNVIPYNSKRATILKHENSLTNHFADAEMTGVSMIAGHADSGKSRQLLDAAVAYAQRHQRADNEEGGSIVVVNLDGLKDDATSPRSMAIEVAGEDIGNYGYQLIPCSNKIGTISFMLLNEVLRETRNLRWVGLDNVPLRKGPGGSFTVELINELKKAYPGVVFFVTTSWHQCADNALELGVIDHLYLIEHNEKLPKEDEANYYDPLDQMANMVAKTPREDVVGFGNASVLISPCEKERTRLAELAVRGAHDALQGAFCINTDLNGSFLNELAMATRVAKHTIVVMVPAGISEGNTFDQLQKHLGILAERARHDKLINLVIVCDHDTLMQIGPLAG